MPAAIGYNPDDKDLRQIADTELRQRYQAIDTARKYYRGKHPLQLDIDEADHIDDNIVINMVQQVTDRVVAFLFPSMPDLELDEQCWDDEDEDFVEDTWEEAGGATLLARAARVGALAGHVFMRVVPAQNGDFPRLILLDPANVLVFWAADDVDTVLWYEIHYKAAGKECRQDVVYSAPVLIDQGNGAYTRQGGNWVIRDWQKAANEWQLQGEYIWPWALAPIVGWPHMAALPGAYYGEGEIGNYPLNDRINKVSSDIARILRIHAFPRTVGTGFKAGAVTETAINNFWTVDNPDAKIFNLEMQSDLQSSMTFLDYLTHAYLAERRVVVLKGDVADMQRVTNLGLRALYIDQIAKNEELRRTYGRAIRQITRLILAVSGKAWQGGIKEIWRDPLPASELETIQIVNQELAVGISSKETAAQRMGLNWDQEMQRMAEEEMMAAMPSSAEMALTGEQGQASQASTASQPSADKADMMEGMGE